MNKSRITVLGMCLLSALLVGITLVIRSMPAQSSGLFDSPRSVTERPVDAVGLASRQPPPELAATSQKAIPVSGEIQKVYRSIENVHSLASMGRPKPSKYSMSRFRLELRYGLREARLLALGYPLEAESLATQKLQSESANDDYVFALHILRYLGAEGGRSSALQILASQVANRDNKRSSLALWALGQADLQGVYRPLFLTKCDEGAIEAIDALSYWADPVAIDVLSRYAQAHQNDRPSFSADLALEAKERVGILLRSDMASVLNWISEPSEGDRFDWALRVAQQRAIPELKNILQKRLDRAIQKEGDLQLIPVESTRGPAIFDTDFDTILIVSAQLGGVLGPWEKAHLEYFGYGCDPRRRLAQILASHK